MTKQETLQKWVRVQNLTSPKHLVINYFHLQEYHNINTQLQITLKVFLSPKS